MAFKNTAPQHGPQGAWSTRFIILLIFIGIVTICAAWVGLPLAWAAWNGARAGDLAAKAEAHWKAGDYEKALPLLAEAYRQAPREPNVLRMMASSFDQVPGAQISALHYWRELQRTGKATTHDKIALGIASLRSDEIKAAREIAEALPPELKTDRKAMEFQALLLAKTGDSAKAEPLMREAWGKDQGDALSRVRLAALNLESPFEELRASGRATLWAEARLEGESKLHAMLALCRAELSPSEWADLASLAGQLGDLFDGARYAVLNACVTKASNLWPEVIQTAKARVEKGDLLARERFYQWMSEHNRADEVLKDLSEDLVVKSRGLFLAYVDSLMRKGRYDQVHRLLALRRAPLSEVDLDLLNAFLARGQGEALEVLQNHLKSAEMRALKSGEEQQLLQVGNGAEVLGALDVAVSVHTALAGHRGYRMSSLKKVFGLQRQRQDAVGMLQAAREMLQEKGDLPLYADSVPYLQLLTGTDLDSAISTLLYAGEPTNVAPTPLRALSTALAAYLI
ncbi:MAG: tetratricopeptide repeat protein, partial [Verrucomicrobiaceae bacterium]